LCLGWRRTGVGVRVGSGVQEFRWRVRGGKVVVGLLL
jgi:hypothetical protein